MKATYNEICELLEWYQQCDRSSFPQCPFKLNYWQTVTGEKFFMVLKHEVTDTIAFLNGDSSKLPVRLNGLIKDLEALQQHEQIDDW